MKGDLATAAMEAGPVDGDKGQGSSSGKRKGRPGAAADRQFTRDELRQLFVLNTVTRCETRELLQGAQKTLRWTDVPGVVSELCFLGASGLWVESRTGWGCKVFQMDGFATMHHICNRTKMPNVWTKKF